MQKRMMLRSTFPAGSILAASKRMLPEEAVDAESGFRNNRGSFWLMLELVAEVQSMTFSARSTDVLRIGGRRRD